MKQIAGFPYFEVQFTKEGRVHERDEVEALLDHVSSGAVTDLVVASHGWNNDIDEARNLYRRLLASLRDRLDARDVPLEARRFAVMAVLWPSKRFADEELIAGGAASIDAPAGEQELVDQLEDLKGTFDDPAADENLDRAKGLVARLDVDPQARADFADLVREALPQLDDDEDADKEFFELPGDELLARLAAPTVPADEGVPLPGTGGAAGSAAGAGPAGGEPGTAAGIGDFFSDIKAGARNLLNLATYYQMKARAGTVGAGGVHDVLRRIKAIRPDVRLHLVGHSFGGRLVAAAALGAKDEPALKTASLTLLQAAFSHYGFAADYEPGHDGFFRSVLSKRLLTGPALITHTRNDKAVGLAYPLASRVARQVASGLGDARDRYGGIGRNGAQKTPEALVGELLASGKPYDFQPGGVYNLEADAFVSDHSDVTGLEIAHALLSAIAVT